MLCAQLRLWSLCGEYWSPWRKHVHQPFKMSKVCLMSVVENSETSDASMRTAASRAVTQVLTVNNTTTEIRFGVDEYILVPAVIDRTAASHWLSSMRRVEGVSLQFGKPGPTAKLKGANRLTSRSRRVPLSTALGLLDSGVKGEITVTRKQGS